MEKQQDGRPTSVSNSMSRVCANDLLARIRELFTRLEIYGRPISVEYGGAEYRVSCDEESFLVYRVNRHASLRHHVPGWPVCLVNSETIFEEHCSPQLGEDHCAAGADINKWLEIIELQHR